LFDISGRVWQLKKENNWPESNEVDDVNKASETVCAWCETSPLPVTDTSTPCSSEVEHIIVNTVCVTSETTNTNTNSLLPNTASNDTQQHVNSTNSGNVHNDSQSDCHTDFGQLCSRGHSTRCQSV
jgi:hypothetical protein